MSWLIEDAPASARPDTTARMVAKATAEMKPRNMLPPTALARWIAAMFEPPLIAAIPLLVFSECRIEERRIGRDKHDRAEADDEGEDVEVTDETGRIEDRLACCLRVLHREEAHQDVRQPCRTEHKGEAERNRR